MKAIEYQGVLLMRGRGDKIVHLEAPYPNEKILCGARGAMTDGVVNPEYRPHASVCPRCLKVEAGEPIAPLSARKPRPLSPNTIRALRERVKTLEETLAQVLASQFVPAAGEQRQGWEYGTLKLKRPLYEKIMRLLAEVRS
jgi:hypothetical protein